MPPHIWPRPRAPDGHALTGGERARRAGRRFCAVEFPYWQPGAQARCARRCRLLGHLEAGRGGPRLRHRDRARARRCRPAARRRAARVRRPGRGLAAPARLARHPQALVHRLDRRRQASARACGRHGEAHDDGARGHAPVIVFDDADLGRTVDLLATAKCRNAGQVCVSPTRFYVQQGIYDRFVAAFTERMRSMKVGDGLAEGTQMGPMANPRRPAAMERFIEDALSHGARLLAGGERHGKEGFFWQPTVLAETPVTARIMNEEPFGPVAVVNPFATFDEAVEQANRLPYGLAAYAFTESGKRAMLIGDAIEAGMVAINAVTLAAADAPFGGVKESGFGAEDGPEGLEACLVTKTIHQA